MTEVDSPRSAVGLGRRFASCDLYPVYSCCPSGFPPGIPRDVCGYLTRENNLRKYIALTCPAPGATWPTGCLLANRCHWIVGIYLSTGKILSPRAKEYGGNLITLLLIYSKDATVRDDTEERNGNITTRG